MSLKDCKSILVTVDFSKDSREAVKEGLALGKMLGAGLVLLHVVHDPAEEPGFYHKKKEHKKSMRLMSDSAAEMMKEFVSKNDIAKDAKSNKISLDTIVSRGLPAAQIINVAKKQKIGMIVMGSSGKTGLSNLLLGSTAERVVQMASIPVLVVKK